MHSLDPQEMLELNRALSYADFPKSIKEIEEEELRKIRLNVQAYVASRNAAGFAVSAILQNYVDCLVEA